MSKAEEEWSREEVEELKIPSHVKAVPWFRDDILSLLRLMKSEVPPLKRAWCKWSVKCFYGLGDASGSNFGVTIQIDGEIH
jgi:hypothetical protein